MKKIISIILILILTMSLVVGCGSEESTEKASVNVISLKGPTAMGMVSFMNDVETGNIVDNEYNFNIAAAIDEVTPKIVKGEVDIAAVPANLSSVLYNNTDGAIQVIAINTLGVLYIVENGNTVQTIDDLKGKTIYASGKGATPEYALNYMLLENGIDPNEDVNIQWKSEHSECLTAVASNKDSIAMLPEPFVTTAKSKMPTIRVAIDMNEEWENLQYDEMAEAALITGVLIARTEFIKEHPEAVEAFLEHYEESVDFTNENEKEASVLIEKYGIVPATIAEAAISKCNITFIDGSEMKEKLSGYLAILCAQNPKSIGGNLPDDEFYYSR